MYFIGYTQCEDVPLFMDGINDGGKIICKGVNSCSNTNIYGINVLEMECNNIGACISTTMDIYGTIKGGYISCEGFESCANTTIFGHNIGIKGLTCNGVDSCRYISASLDGINDGLRINCQGNHSCADSHIVATNVDGTINCGSISSCDNSILNIVCQNNKGCELKCGINGCQYSIMDIKHINNVDCDESKACYNAVINVDVIGKSFVLKCGEQGCMNAEINIYIRDPSITTIKGVSCESNQACMNSIINIVSLTGNTVQIQEFKCGASESCDNTIISLIGTEIAKSVCVPPNCPNTIITAPNAPVSNMKRVQAASEPINTVSETNNQDTHSDHEWSILVSELETIAF